jgi:nicotinate-nucleotide adenylyltransferase
MKIGIFPGSFNPVHIGHLAIANYIAEFESFDEVWFLITPQSPLKGLSEIIPQELRLELVDESIAGYEKFKTCTIEWDMPKPSYTIATLQKLKITYPDYKFELIIGSDNWELFHRWKDYQRILNNFKVVVYPRRGSHHTHIDHFNVRMCQAPMFEISSTFIRKQLAKKKNVRFFLPNGVYERLVASGIFN